MYLLGRGVVVRAVTGRLDRRGYPAAVRGPVARGLHAVVWLVALGAGFALAGAEGVVVAVGVLAGALVVAAGVGARDQLGDAAAGAALLREARVTPGDHVEWNGLAGRVEEVGLRTTTVQRSDGTRLRVPNRELAGATVAVEAGGATPSRHAPSADAPTDAATDHVANRDTPADDADWDGGPADDTSEGDATADDTTEDDTKGDAADDEV